MTSRGDNPTVFDYGHHSRNEQMAMISRLVKRLQFPEETMKPMLRDIINEAWDQADDDPTRDFRVMPDSAVADQLGIPKWKVIAGRQGYRRQEARRPGVRTVRDGSASSGFCSTMFRYIDVSLPRVSILEAA